MALIVQKYGGISVGSLERMRNVAERAIRTQAEGNEVVLTSSSAMSGETNRLLGLAHQHRRGARSRRELDALAATGEQVERRAQSP